MNLKEFIEYIPNCLICGKVLSLKILLQNYHKHFSMYYLSGEIKDNVFQNKTYIRSDGLPSKELKVKFKIDLISNKILEGMDIFNDSSSNKNISIVNRCKTCTFIKRYTMTDFKSGTQKLSSINMDSISIFIHFYIKNKQIDIFYSNNNMNYNYSDKTGCKSIKLPMNLEKISNKKQLLDHINMLIPFI